MVGFQSKRGTERFLDDLKERLAGFWLDSCPKKTHLVEFGRFAAANRGRRGQGKPETLDFPGLTHYVTRTREGRIRPDASRLRRG